MCPLSENWGALSTELLLPEMGCCPSATTHSPWGPENPGFGAEPIVSWLQSEREVDIGGTSQKRRQAGEAAETGPLHPVLVGLALVLGAGEARGNS